VDLPIEGLGSATEESKNLLRSILSPRISIGLSNNASSAHNRVRFGGRPSELDMLKGSVRPGEEVGANGGR